MGPTHRRLELLRGRLRRSGGWLNENVLQDAPPHPRRSPLAAGGIALAIAMLVGIQLLRMRLSAPLNSIWAEDGFAWLSGALHQGFFHTLVSPYHGYLQTLSRLVAAPVSLLPVRWFAPVMALSGTLLVVGCVAIVWHCSAGYIHERRLRLGLCVLIVLTPVASVEVFANVTNSIWFLPFASFWLLLWRPASFGAACGAASILLLAALSTASIILLFPVWVLRALALRDRRDAVIVAAPAVGVLAQVPSLLTPPAGLPGAHWSFGLFPAYAQRILGAGVLGNRVAGHAWTALGVPFEVLLSAVLVAGVLGVAFWLSRRTKVLVVLMVVVSVLMFVVSGYQRDLAGSLIWSHGHFNASGARYLIGPSLLLVGALFIALDDRVMVARFRRWPLAGTGVVLTMVVLALTSFYPYDHAFRGNPTWSDTVSQARTRCARTHVSSVSLPVEPIGSLQIPCHRLT